MGKVIYGCTQCYDTCTQREETVVEKGQKCVPKKDPEEFVIKNVGPGSFAMYKEELEENCENDDLKLNESLEIIQMKTTTNLPQPKTERSQTMIQLGQQEADTLSNKMNSERKATNQKIEGADDQNPYMSKTSTFNKHRRSAMDVAKVQMVEVR